MNEPNKNLILCAKVKDLNDPSSKDVKISSCDFCKEEIWIDQESLDKVSENGLPVRLCCNDCLLRGEIDMENMQLDIDGKNGLINMVSSMSRELRKNWK